MEKDYLVEIDPQSPVNEPRPMWGSWQSGNSSKKDKSNHELPDGFKIILTVFILLLFLAALIKTHQLEAKIEEQEALIEQLQEELISQADYDSIYQDGYKVGYSDGSGIAEDIKDSIAEDAYTDGYNDGYDDGSSVSPESNK